MCVNHHNSRVFAVSIQPWAMPPANAVVIAAVTDRPHINVDMNDDNVEPQVDAFETRMNRPLFPARKDHVVPSPGGIRRRMTVQ